MAKPWDLLMKALISLYPQQFVSWVLRGAVYRHGRSTELTTRAIYPDILLDVFLKRKPMILHLEFQRSRDATMGKRMWEYNTLTTTTSGLIVWSVAIYLKAGGTIEESPYEVKRSDGEIVHLFYYDVIKLWELPVEELKQLGLEVLLPLWPWSKGGERREVIEEMIEQLKTVGNDELLYLGVLSAADVLKGTPDQHWIRGIYMKHKDIFEDNPILQLTMKEGRARGRAEGRVEGRQEGIAEGELRAERRLVVKVVQARFPELAPFAQKQVAALTDIDLLSNLIVTLSNTSTSQEAEQALITIEKDDKKN